MTFLRPDNSPVSAIRLLEKNEEDSKESNVLLVGHNPYLSEFIPG